MQITDAQGGKRAKKFIAGPIPWFFSGGKTSPEFVFIVSILETNRGYYI